MSHRPLVRTLLYLHQQLERAADGGDMSISQYFLLHFLHEEPRRAAEFAVVNKRRKPGITSMVARLEARGWVERSPDPTDGRAQIISITRAGQKAFDDFEAGMQTALEGFLGVESVRDTDKLLEPFYRAWNDKRLERFNSWRKGRDDDQRRGDDESANISAGRAGRRRAGSAGRR